MPRPLDNVADGSVRTLLRAALEEARHLSEFNRSYTNIDTLGYKPNDHPSWVLDRITADFFERLEQILSEETEEIEPFPWDKVPEERRWVCKDGHRWYAMSKREEDCGVPWFFTGEPVLNRGKDGWTYGDDDPSPLERYSKYLSENDIPEWYWELDAKDSKLQRPE